MKFANITRRAAVLGAMGTLTLPALAQAFPSKPIRIVLGFGAGGTTDAVARLYGQKLSEVLNTPVVIDNRPGANQLAAIRALLSSPADGYTLYCATYSSLVQNPSLRKNMPYDTLKDFTLLGVLTYLHGVVFVSPDLPVRSLKELLAYGEANPGKLLYGHAGLGTAGHLSAEAFMSATGLKMVAVPYKADAEIIREAMAGRVHVSIMTTLNTVAYISAGQIRGLAVTNPGRLPFLPDVPGLTESGVKGLEQFQPYSYNALVGPAGMPPAVTATLVDAINKVSAMPDVVNRVRDVFFSETAPAGSSGPGFRTLVEKQFETWAELGKTVVLSD